MENRYNYNHPLNFWEWAFLRNFNLFTSSQDKIFVPCKERITNRSRFRFCILKSNIYPTQDVTALFKKENVQEDIRYAAALLNSKYVFNWLTNKGIRKGDIIEFSENPISIIPFRKINFNDKKEVEIHNNIVSLVREYENTQNKNLLNQIDSDLDKLME